MPSTRTRTRIGYILRTTASGSFFAVAVSPGPGVPQVVEAETLDELVEKLRDALGRRQPDGRRTRPMVRVSSLNVIREIARA